MPTVRISDATWKKLQLLAVPFVDTPEKVISDLVDVALTGKTFQRSVQAVTPTVQPKVTQVAWDVEPHDDLRHTKIISACLGATNFPKANWTLLVKFAHEVAFENLGSFSAVQRVTHANLKKGKYEEDGYTYIPGIDVSIQGMDANHSWDNIVRIAHALHLPASVQFHWRQSSNAAKPGMSGSIYYNP